MIQTLNQENFGVFGTVVSREELSIRHLNNHSISLSPQSAWVYQTAADTWLQNESGDIILSVSRDREQYRDFYLDKPVVLKDDVYFTLTAFREKATVQMAGFSLPRLLETHVAAEHYVVEPQVKLQRLYAIFYQEKERGFLHPGEAHSMLELIYVDRGSLHSVADGKDLLLCQGDMVLYGPNQWHMQYAQAEEAPRIVSVNFDATGLDLQKIANRKFEKPAKAVALLHQILAEQERMDGQAQDFILCYLTQLLLSLHREEPHRGDKLQMLHSVNNENEIIRRAQQYIGTHVRQKLSVPIVAGGIEVSASYLTALFQKHLQISPGEYIRRIKLQESKQMIREGNMNFTEIATSLHYSTIHHFSRQFKDKFGITPTEYAKSVRG